MGLKLFTRKPSDAAGTASVRAMPDEERVVVPPAPDFDPAPSESFDSDPLRRMLQQGRYATVLRDENKWLVQPDGPAAVRKAKQRLEHCMALVPAGSVTMTQTLGAQPGAAEEEIDVAPFLLDIYCVTNARYQKFVDAGGYDALDFWPEEIWPHLIELKDLTGQPGPRFWRSGRHDRKLGDHPVVGVSWYEAQAYALWIGQRLPTEGEWQMAASWHIRSSADLMRRFPWGDAMDNARCNIWSSRHGTTVPVDRYPKGVAPNHVQQLVGNVWEWTDTEYLVADDDGRPIIGEMPMHVVRGGAFDTYFETQATNYFRTGQLALARVQNIGFRCAMDLSDATWMNGD
jgi:iron(II)-dependent oxidoreductase